MLSKRKMGRGKVRVTFAMPPLDNVEQLHLVGDFNNWSITANPMQRTADGAWTTALTLEGGRRYQYRYLANGVEWHNDWAADAYVPNQFGTDNCVVNTELPAPAPRKRASKKAAA